MRDISELRNEINDIDKKIVSLMEKRYDISKEVGLYKKENSKDILDSSREAEVIKTRTGYLSNHEYDDFIVSLMEKIMAQSKGIQREIAGGDIKAEKRSFTNARVCFCGIEGSYAHMALKKYFGDISPVKTGSFEESFEKLQSRECDFAVLPVENSFTGGINNVYDLLFKYGFYIIGEEKIRISHVLAAKRGEKISDIKKVYSHIQALNQCEDFLSSLNNVEKIPFYNTAAAAQLVSNFAEKNIAAVASREASEIYGLDVLAENISVKEENFTRFIIVSREKTEENGNKISLAFTLEHEKGTLYRLLSVFDRRNYNLVKIESRPFRNKNWEYLFFLDFITDSDKDIGKLLEEITPLTNELKYLGRYEAD